MSPHLFWNAQNDFVSFKFQINRGFFSDYNSSVMMANKLPNPYPKKHDTKPREKHKNQSILKPVRKASEFLGASFSTIRFIHPQYTLRPLSLPKEKLVIDSKDLILWYSALFPLAFFGFVSSFQKVEANWAVIYSAGASLLITKYLPLNIKVIKWESVFHAGLLMLLLFHTSFPIQHRAISKRSSDA